MGVGVSVLKAVEVSVEVQEVKGFAVSVEAFSHKTETTISILVKFIIWKQII